VNSSLLGSSAAPWHIILLITALSLLPAVIMSVTPFVRLLVVFHFLRQALGTQTSPSNQILIGLALFLSWFVMQPVLGTIYAQAILPLSQEKITIEEALARTAEPMRTFMLRYAREKDLALFLQSAGVPRPSSEKDIPVRVVIPAYILSELHAGFQIGAALFIPFAVIDLAVAFLTTSVGLMQLPPIVLSTPLKIFLFVAVDGWNLLVSSLLRGLH